MKINIAYDSKYGNGKKCCEHLQNVLRARGNQTEIFNVRQTKPKQLPPADTYIFSSPTHIGGVPRKMKKFIKNLVPASGAKYTFIITYMDQNANTNEKMDALLQPKGMGRLTDGIMIKVEGMKGPLEDGFEKKLDQFAAKILGGK
jgi:flavodoxin